MAGRRRMRGAPAAAFAILAAILAAATLFASPARAAVDRLLLDADSLTYDRDHKVVTASGDVQLYYKGRALQADRVSYDQATRRVTAQGHVKMTDPSGVVTYADKVDATDDYSDGFVESLVAVGPDQTTFSAARAERLGGVATSLDHGAYTACVPCSGKPAAPPLWQIKAVKIVQDSRTHTVYFRDMTLEVGGVPVFWTPWFATADATVRRHTGFLTPSVVERTGLGVGFTQPFFWAIAPNRDLTLTPTYWTQQGLYADLKWRHRLQNGEYAIRAAGVFQSDPEAFKPAPFATGRRAFRGMLQTDGKFWLDKQWAFGWNASLLSDPFFVSDYALNPRNLSNYYVRELVSDAWLVGQGPRSWFDLHAYHFQGLATGDLQSQQPDALPVLDYDRQFALAAGPKGVLELEANFAAMTAQAATFQNAGAAAGPSLYGVCAPGTYVPGQCLLRGIGGELTRASAQATWSRRIVDPLGDVLTPFAFVRGDANWRSLDLARTYSYYDVTTGLNQTFSNASQLGVLGPGSPAFAGRLMPGIGLDWRYPLVASTGIGAQTLTPIAQIVARPNEGGIGAVPNMDAQSLVFDVTDLFAWNKFSGFDRVEGGVRANYGVKWQVDFAGGGFGALTAGRSSQLAGRNSYATPDAAGVGLDSGLATANSAFVFGENLALNEALSFAAKQQYDPATHGFTRLDALARGEYGAVSATVGYARYAAQPDIGFYENREGVYFGGTLKLGGGWHVDGSALFDLSRRPTVAAETVPNATAFALGFGVTDACHCTSFDVSYQQGLGADPTTGTLQRSSAITFALTLRTLGGDTLQRTSGLLGQTVSGF